MINSAKKIVGFDLDGVLIDSIPVMQQAWNKVCHTYLLDIPFKSYQHHIGKPFGIIMNQLSLEHLLPDIKVDYDRYSMDLAANVHTFEPVANCLNSLTLSPNFHTAIITSKTKIRARFLIEHLGLKCHLLVTPEDVPRGKPFADPLLFANRHFSIRAKPSSSLYIGDMDSDRDAAVSANWSYVHCQWGYQLMPISCANILTQPHQLAPFIESWYL